MKWEYGIGGFSIPDRGDFIDDAFYTSKNMKLYKNHFSANEVKVVLSWNKIEKRIQELIDENQYFIPEKETENIIENDEETIKTVGFDKEKLNMVTLYEKLKNILLKRRQKNGYIGFDMPEVQIILDENGKTVGVENKKKIFAYSIIEHLMLTANEVVAETFTKKDVPVMYRVHEYPSLEKIEEVNLTLQKFGLKLNTFRIDEHLLNKKDVSNERFRKR